MKTIPDGPFLFRVAKFLQHKKLRGGSFLIRNLKRFGMIDVLATYQLGTFQFGIPLNHLQWDIENVESYETRLIGAFCAALEPLHDVTLI